MQIYPFKPLLQQLDSTSVVATKIWIHGGSKLDPTNQRGIHQLLGSCMSRGCGPYDYLKLGDLVEGCGAGIHCDTYEDGMLVSLKCLETDFEKLLPVLAWMISDPHLDSEQIKIERELTLQALKRQKENPFYVAYDGWRELAFGQGGYGHDPLGEIQDLSNLRKQDIDSLANSLPSRIKALVISGSFSKDSIDNILINEPFISLFNSKKNLSFGITQNKDISQKASFERGLHLNFEKTSQVIIMLGNTTIGHNDKDALSLQLLSCYLGSGMSSKLFVELREKHGVAYEVGVYHPTRESNAPFVIHVSTTEQKASFVLKLLNEIIETIKNTSLTDRELIRAKTKYKSQIAHSTQTVSQKAERKAQLLGLDLPHDYDFTNIEKVEAINQKDLIKAANKYLANPLLSLCGPRVTLEKLSQEWDY